MPTSPNPTSTGVPFADRDVINALRREVRSGAAPSQAVRAILRQHDPILYTHVMWHFATAFGTWNTALTEAFMLWEPEPLQADGTIDDAEFNRRITHLIHTTRPRWAPAA